MDGGFRHRAQFVGADVYAAVQAGRADFVPVFLSDIPLRLCVSASLRLCVSTSPH
jgi:hypothetical protein